MSPSPAPTECVMFLVRHGATANNIANPPLLQGCKSDPALSDTGMQQANATARFLAELPVRAIYSSPLHRARETAEVIGGPHQLDIQIIEQITEIDVGAWEMRSWQEISRTEPEAYDQFMADPANCGYRDGECLNDVHARIIPALTQIMLQHLGESIVVVAHNVVNRVLLADLLGLPIAKARGISQDNCGINVVRYVDGAMKLKSTNCAFHL